MAIYHGTQKIVGLYHGTDKIVKRYKGTQLIFQSRVLPAGFIECEYLESTGTQYIELPFGFYKTDKVETKLSVDTSQKADKYMVAPKIWNDNKNRFGLGVHSAYVANGGYTAGYGDAITSSTLLQPPTTNDGLLHKWQYKDYVFSVVDLGLTKDVNSIVFETTTANLKLFYGYNTNTIGKIASYKHWKNNQLICNLIPCLDNTGTPCLYDRVSKTAFYNQGTGKFKYKVKIPNAYQQVEYIESSGTQYIDTGYVPQDKTSIDVSFEYNVLPTSSSYQTLISAGVGTYQLVEVEASNVIYFRYFSTGSSSATYNPALNTKYNINISSNGELSVDNHSAQSAYQGVVDTNLFLLRRANNINYFIGKLYSCQIYDNGSLVRCFVPCYHKSDNVIGLYDAVNDKFYTNAGTGTFTKGGDI